MDLEQLLNTLQNLYYILRNVLNGCWMVIIDAIYRIPTRGFTYTFMELTINATDFTFKKIKAKNETRLPS